MACAHLNSKPSYTYADFVYESLRAGLTIHDGSFDCLMVHCQDCTLANEQSILYGEDCESSITAALAYHNAGLIDITELLI